MGSRVSMGSTVLRESPHLPTSTQVIDDTKITTEEQQILVKANYGQSWKQMLSVGIGEG